MLFTFQLMKHRPTAFQNFLNYDLLKELMKLADDVELQRKYSETFNVAYIGEIGERWHEREGLINNAKDLLALTVALGSHRADTHVLYTQRERFAVQAIHYLLNVDYDFVTAATVLSYTVRPHLSTADSEMAVTELFDKVLQDTESIERLTTPQLAFTLYNLMQGIKDLKDGCYQLEKAEDYRLVLTNMKQLSFTLIDQLLTEGVQLEQYETPFEDVPILEMLAKIYSVFDKPKAKNFKTKGAVRYLQCFEGLMYKEVDLLKAIGYVELLKVDLRSIFIYNYELAILREGSDYTNLSTITRPGSERIKENFVNYGFLSKITLEDEYKKRLESFRGSEKYLNGLFVKTKVFKNPLNLSYLVQDLGHRKVVSNVTKAHMDLLDTGFLTDEQKHTIGKCLLEGKSYHLREFDLSEDEFIHLYQLMQSLHAKDAVTYPYPSTTRTFILNCLKFKVFTPFDIETIMALKAEGIVATYLLNEKDVEGLLDFLNGVHLEKHVILINEFDAIEKLLIEKEYSTALIQRFYEHFLHVLFELDTKNYASTVFRLQKNDDLFKSAFELTVEELEVVEKKLFETALLEEKEQMYLYNKYTSPEIIESKRIESLIEKIKGCKSYNYFKNFYQEHYVSLKNSQILSREYAERFIHVFLEEIEQAGSYDAGQYLATLYRIKATAVLTAEDIALIEQALLEKYRRFESEVIRKIAANNEVKA